MSEERKAYLTTETEGYIGQEKKTFEETEEFWMEIYAAYQNKSIVQRVVSAIEEHAGPDGENTPCMIVKWGDSIKGIIPAPLSSITGATPTIVKNKMRKMVGKNVVFKIKNIDRENKLCLLSRSEAKEEMQERAWKKIKAGIIVPAVVREVTDKVVKVNIGGIDTIIPASELSHGWIHNLRSKFKVGDTFDVKVKEVNKEEKSLRVSLKDLLKDPWEKVPEKYVVEGEYLGRITNIEEFGVFVNLENGVDVLLAMPKNDFTRNLMTEGGEALVRITKIDLNKSRIYGRLVRVNV